MAILEPVVPYLQQRRRYNPIAGDELSITLPGELSRGVILEVLNDNAVTVKITKPTMVRHHGYNKDEIVGVRRVVGDHGVEIWRAISEREMQNAEARLRFEDEERAKEAAEAAAKLKAIDQPGNYQAQAAGQSAAESIPMGITERRKVLGPRRSKIAKG